MDVNCRLETGVSEAGAYEDRVLSLREQGRCVLVGCVWYGVTSREPKSVLLRLCDILLLGPLTELPGPAAW